MTCVHVRGLLVACALVGVASCGDDDTPVVPRDAGTDAGPPPCIALSVPLGTRPLPDLAGCGVCVEEYARVARVYDFGVSFGIEVAAVDGGLLVATHSIGGGLSFITLDGRVVALDERPWLDPVTRDPGYLFRGLAIAPVPGRPEVWVVVGLRCDRDAPSCSPDDAATDVVLYRYDEAGFERLAAVRTEHQIGKIAALPDATLVAEWDDGDSGFGFARVAARGDGSADVAFPRNVGLPASRVVSVWSLATGEAAWLLEHFPRPSRDAIEYWLAITDNDLVATKPLVMLSPAADDLTYDRPVYATRPHRRVDGTTTVLVAIDRAGLDAADLAHYWLNRVDPDGTVQFDSPGVWVNPDQYLRREDTWDGGNFAARGFALPGRSNGVAWDDFTGGDSDSLVVHVQRILEDGSRAFTEARDFDWDSGLFFFGSIWTIDGADHAYSGQLEGLASERVLVFEAMSYDADLTPRWAEPARPQQCPDRFGQENPNLVGAYDEGLWMVWDDYLYDNTGHGLSVTKVALIRPDGTFAWGAP